MSVEYFVAVQQANWPTAAAVQTCLVERGYPVRLASAPAKPFAAKSTLTVRFRGRATKLDAFTVELSPATPYAYHLPPDLTSKSAIELMEMGPDDVFPPADINADLASIGADVRFANGDHVLDLSFGSSPSETRAGFYLMAGMIRCFHGYGFEFGGPSHGAEAYADRLVADAADDAQWARKPSAPDDLSPATKRGLDKFLEDVRKSARAPSP